MWNLCYLVLVPANVRRTTRLYNIKMMNCRPIVVNRLPCGWCKCTFSRCCFFHPPNWRNSSFASDVASHSPLRAFWREKTPIFGQWWSWSSGSFSRCCTMRVCYIFCEKYSPLFTRELFYTRADDDKNSKAPFKAQKRREIFKYSKFVKIIYLKV